MNLTELLATFLQLPGPLPADAIPGLVAVAAQTDANDHVRSRLILSTQVPRDLALTLVGPAPRRENYGLYLGRPDTPTSEALAAIETASTTTLINLAHQSKDPAVLQALAGDRHEQVLMAVAKNPRAPLPVAAAAIARAVEAQAAADAARAAAGQPPFTVDGIRALGYDWLKYPHSVPDAVIEEWALTTSNLDALVVAISGRPQMSAAVRVHTVELALSLVPTQTQDLDEVPAVLTALNRMVHLKGARDPAVTRVREAIAARGLRVGTVRADKALNLPAPDGPAQIDLSSRAWRNTAKKALKETPIAAALLRDLVRLAGTDPAAWTTMARLSETHTGSVEALAETAAAIASEPAR